MYIPGYRSRLNRIIYLGNFLFSYVSGRNVPAVYSKGGGLLLYPAALPPLTRSYGKGRGLLLGSKFSDWLGSSALSVGSAPYVLPFTRVLFTMSYINIVLNIIPTLYGGYIVSVHRMVMENRPVDPGSIQGSHRPISFIRIKRRTRANDIV